MLSIGDVFVHERTFDHDDVRAFTRVSGDAGTHHEVAGADGRLLVHGLLTATIPTKIGGDLDYLAREMHFEFVRPVYTGDAIRCEMTITELDARADRIRLALTGACSNQHGEEVLRIVTRGVIRKPAG
jgi:3-hydroxybutyryl-CoA dehydratase